ncbi:DUF2946 domain-containing protein [Undibacterium sp. FT147W]|uniref:DUF2946 domain-containing protein n=1 Tax=Undibacterium rivi TaxID=2828729 RepID=A0ABS5GZY7_9BURK|nr:DUF2946 domain-containing protein [Undibacterium rivi]MBR7792029.1 DUF2946 domain-containing protein [Undibacterium rivi]
MRNRRRTKGFSWIAILAILLNSLMPLASQAINHSSAKSTIQAGEWKEICSTNGLSWVLFSPAGAVLEKTNVKPANVSETMHFEHCAYCLTNAASFALPPVPEFTFSVTISESQFFSFQTLAVAKKIAWLVPSVRAPPVSL